MLRLHRSNKLRYFRWRETLGQKVLFEQLLYFPLLAWRLWEGLNLVRFYRTYFFQHLFLRSWFSYSIVRARILLIEIIRGLNRLIVDSLLSFMPCFKFCDSLCCDSLVLAKCWIGLRVVKPAPKLSGRNISNGFRRNDLSFFDGPCFWSAHHLFSESWSSVKTVLLLCCESWSWFFFCNQFDWVLSFL